MPILRCPGQTILVHTIDYRTVEYNGQRYQISKVLGGSAQWYDDADYFIQFDENGIVFEAVEYIPTGEWQTNKEICR